MSPREIVERESRWAMPVVVAGVLGAMLTLIFTFTNASLQPMAGGTLPEVFRQYDANSGLFELNGVIGLLGMVGFGAVVIYLFRAAQARSPRVAGGLFGLAVLGPALYGLQNVIGGFAGAHVGHEFVSQAGGVGDVFTLSKTVAEDSGLLKFASYLQLAGTVALIVILIYTALWATRTGLLTRFTGTLGMALAASLLINPILALPALSVWVAYISLLFIDRMPGRERPPAWAMGEAVAPLRAGEEAPVAAGPASRDVIDGDATEIPGVDENPNAARRERAKRKKRKQRRR